MLPEEAIVPRAANAEIPSQLRRLLPPLIFASGVCGALLLLRWGYSGKLRFSGFFGNLLLAWIPLVLTMVIRWLRTAAKPRLGWMWFCALCWLLFFPNASYIVTDMVHLGKHSQGPVLKQFDIVMMMAYACTGLFIGCVSLQETEALVSNRLGKRFGWSFSIVMLALASFGIYLGRFLRLNSWDFFVQPWRLVGKMMELLHPPRAKEVMVFSLCFFLFSLAMYWFISCATRPAENDREAV